MYLLPAFQRRIASPRRPFFNRLCPPSLNFSRCKGRPQKIKIKLNIKTDRTGFPTPPSNRLGGGESGASAKSKATYMVKLMDPFSNKWSMGSPFPSPFSVLRSPFSAVSLLDFERWILRQASSIPPSLVYGSWQVG